MQGKQQKAPLLRVPGFRTIERTGRYGKNRNVVLEWCGGNARDAVHALRDEMIKRNDGEVAGLIIRGLSKKYDIMFELDRETIEGRTKTAVKFSCWRHVPSGQEKPQKPHHEEILLPTATPGIRITSAGQFRARLGHHSLGTFPTYKEAVCAKALYVAKIGHRPGPKPNVGNCNSEKLANASVRS
ncbi:MAG: hypothetical protein NTY23_11895 [Chloroflexi bacterium]|nr:hypothetical protein [Chloroflexota bacterium]